MTQLDRLEALAEKWRKMGSLPPHEEMELAGGTYDLIRLARAAKLLLDASEIMVTHPEVDLTIDDWLRFGASVNEVKPALAPLYREVES